jgi:hypothetical protein
MGFNAVTSARDNNGVPIASKSRPAIAHQLAWVDCIFAAPGDEYEEARNLELDIPLAVLASQGQAERAQATSVGIDSKAFGTYRLKRAP